MEPVSIADEVPFEIPDSWEWVRLASVFSVLNGDRGKNYPAKSTLSRKGIPFISALNLDGKTVVNDDNLLCMSEEQYRKLGNGKLVKNDIVVCIRGSLGKHGRFPFDKGAIASSLVILRPHSDVDTLSNYIMMYLDTPLFFAEIKKYDNGTAQPNLAAKSLEQFFVPIPPVREQKRILRELAVLEPYILKYQDAFEELEGLNDSFPDMLIKSILQLAVQGKLVPQDPNDEPASVLLEKIRAEKERLIKEGKIKRDKSESVIFRRDNSHYEKLNGSEHCIDEEIPFDIPDSWCWSRLGDLGISQTGNTPSKAHPEYFGDYIPFIGPGDISNGLINYNNQGLSVEGEACGRTIPEKSIVQVCIGGSIGKAAIAQRKIAFNQQINAITLIIADYRYLFYVMTCPTFIGFMKDHAGGTATPIINRGLWDKMLIPVPPLEEQHRIVQAIERLFPYCDKL